MDSELYFSERMIFEREFTRISATILRRIRQEFWRETLIHADKILNISDH